MENPQGPAQYQNPFQATAQPPQQQQTMMVMPVQPGGMVVGGERCRGNSKCVAWMDIVFSVLGIVVNAVAVSSAILILDEIDHGRINIDKNLVHSLIVFSIVGMIVEAIALVFACVLLTAASLGTPKDVAIRRAKLYRNFNICRVVLTFISGCVSLVNNGDAISYLSVIFSVVLRISFIIVVHKFIKELKYGGGGIFPMTGAAVPGVQQMSYSYTSTNIQNQQPYQPQIQYQQSFQNTDQQQQQQQQEN